MFSRSFFFLIQEMKFMIFLIVTLNLYESSCQLIQFQTVFQLTIRKKGIPFLIFFLISSV